MKLTNPEAIKALKKVRIEELEEMIDSYPEDEVDGRSDWEMIANEAGWLLDSYNSEECVRHDDLIECKTILRETHYGKTMPLTWPELKPKYREYQVKDAKHTVNEYKCLTRFVAKLKGMGLYCPYC